MPAELSQSARLYMRRKFSQYVPTATKPGRRVCLQSHPTCASEPDGLPDRPDLMLTYGSRSPDTGRAARWPRRT